MQQLSGNIRSLLTGAAQVWLALFLAIASFVIVRGLLLAMLGGDDRLASGISVVCMTLVILGLELKHSSLPRTIIAPEHRDRSQSSLYGTANMLIRSMVSTGLSVLITPMRLLEKLLTNAAVELSGAIGALAIAPAPASPDLVRFPLAWLVHLHRIFLISLRAGLLVIRAVVVLVLTTLNAGGAFMVVLADAFLLLIRYAWTLVVSRSPELIGQLPPPDPTAPSMAGLEPVPVSPEDVTVAGFVGLNTWLAERQASATMLSRFGVQPSGGVLITGVPGYRKSLAAKSIAASLNMHLYRLDLGKVYEQDVGESEQRLELALATADRLAPCVLWIDRIERALADGSERRASLHFLAQLLHWLDGRTVRVFLIGTADDATKFPPELLRPGRFDKLFFVDLPSDSERREIISLYARRYLKTAVSDDLLDELVTLSEGFATGDLEDVLDEVAHTAPFDPGEPLDDKPWRETFSKFIPSSRTNPDELKRIRAWGRKRAMPVSGHPIDDN
jgi:hypothetical protein